MKKTAKNMSNETKIEKAKQSALTDILKCLPQNTKAYIKKLGPKFKTFINAFLQGHVGSIKICDPERCEYQTCPLKAENIAPKGYFCPMETIYIDRYIEMYKDTFNPSTAADIIRMIDLVTTQLLQNRALAQIALDGTTVMNPKAILQKTATPIMGPDAHPLFDVYNKLQQTKERLLKSLSKQKEDGDNIVDAAYEIIQKKEEMPKDEKVTDYEKFFGDVEILNDDETPTVPNPKEG